MRPESRCKGIAARLGRCRVEPGPQKEEEWSWPHADLGGGLQAVGPACKKALRGADSLPAVHGSEGGPEKVGQRRAEVVCER